MRVPSQRPPARSLAAAIVASVVVTGGCGSTTPSRPATSHAPSASTRSTTATSPQAQPTPQDLAVRWTLHARRRPATAAPAIPFPDISLDYPCDRQPAPGAIVLEHVGPPRGMVGASGAVALGDAVTVCVKAFAADLPLDVVARQAGQVLAHRHFFAGDEDMDRSHTFVLGSRWRRGAGTVAVTQAGRATTATFDVVEGGGPPRIVTSADAQTVAGQPVDVAVRGERPHAHITIDAYRRTPDDFRYHTTLSLTTNRMGAAYARLSTTRADADDWELRLRHGGVVQAQAPVGLPLLYLGRPAALPPGTAPRDVFERHDAPPAGIARQLAYFQQGGPIECTEPTDGGPAIAFARDMPRPGTLRDTSRPQEDEIGDFLHICPWHFDPEAPIDLTVRTPSGARRTLPAPATLAAAPAIGVIELLGPTSERGTYRVTAQQQGGLIARARFTVRDAATPGYRVITLRRGVPTVFATGLPPDADAQVLLYKVPSVTTVPPFQTFQMRALFVAAVGMRTNAHGIAVADLRPDPHAAQDDCFIAKVAYGAHVLSDLNNTIGYFCLPYGDPRPPSF